MSTRLRWIFACAGLVSLQVKAQETISNNLYSVTLDASAGGFSVESTPTGKTFLENGKLSGRDGTVQKIDLSDKLLGAGAGLEVTYPNGNSETVGLYDTLPFVTFRSTFHNSTSHPIVLNHVPDVEAQVDLGGASDDIISLGTGGLLSPAKNPGSYAFLALAKPESRNGLVAGWITEDRGSGVVFSPVSQGTVSIAARTDYGCLRILPGKYAEGEMLALGYFDDARQGLEAYGDAIARVYSVKLPPKQAGFSTWYMEKFNQSCDEKHLAELSSFASQNLKDYGLGFIQIDDGWQLGSKNNGPKKNFSNYDPHGPYPSGMKATADMIKSLGLTPGIWFMPFAGNYEDPFFAQHQDWFVKRADGKPYDTVWGGTCLDMTNPGAREYLKSNVSRIAQDWGYQLFKMDGFWTGSATKQIYVNSGYKEDGMGDAVFFNPDKTNIEALRDGVKLVRETVGPKVFLLGCCIPQNMRSFGGSFGLLDAMRIGRDSGSASIGADAATRLWFLNGRVWWNDPDCVSVRKSAPLDQARLNASFAAIADTIFYNSDWMPDLPPDRLDILRRCMPSHDLPAYPVDVLERQPARIWHLADTRTSVRRDIVALFNYEKKPAHISYALSRIGLPPAETYVAFDFWANKFVSPFHGTLDADLPAGGSCRILAIQPLSDYPRILSTSRHITQGIVDLSQEKWDGATDSLSGTSSVVGNDPYELRLVVPVGDKSWSVTLANVSPDDVTAGVTSSFVQDGTTIRVTLKSNANRSVGWTIHFKSSDIAAQSEPPAELSR